MIHLFELMEAESSSNSLLFRKLMMQVSVVAILVHLAFTALFHINEIPLLAGFNVISVAMYAAAFHMTRVRQHMALAWVLVVTEIVAHAALAVYLIGWDSGFHFYIMLIPPVMMVSPIRFNQLKMFAVMAMMMLYILMDYGLRRAMPEFQMDDTVLNSLHYFNLVAVLSLMVFLTGLYFRLVVISQRKLHQLATTDSLTGLQNRRSAQKQAVRQIDKHQQEVAPLSLLLCDLDYFKQVNDKFGHQLGDEVLKTFSELIASVIRNDDLAARWGGEEFLILLPGTDNMEALKVAERIRHELQGASLSLSGRCVNVTTTIGIAELLPQDDFDSLLARADEALYRGKASGRNQVVDG